MTTFSIAATVFAGLILLIWLSRHIMINRELARGEMLGPDSPGPGSTEPSVHIVVAARDEAENIDRCLRSLLAQDYPRLQVTCVDDRSEDETESIARRVAAEDSRLRVIRVDELPDGWMGKNHAMHVGVQGVQSDMLLFTDADCDFHCRRAVSVAVAYAGANEAGLLSVLPVLATDSFWEHVVQPVCGGVMMIWFHPDKVNNPRRSNAYANGAFMLFTREAYEQVGGHEALADSPNEDLQLARRAKASGAGLRVVRNRDLYSVRMYRRLGQIFKGWTRIFLGAFASWPKMIISILVLICVSLSPWILAGVGTWAAMSFGGWQWALAAVAWAAVAMQLSVIARFYRMLEAGAALAVTYPLGCLVVLAILLSAAGKMLPGGRVEWRGAVYAGSQAVRK